MLLAKMVTKAIIDMAKQERKSNFLRPRDDESPSVARARPPNKHPMKKQDEGKLERIDELGHSRLQSDMIVVSEGRSQAHEDFERVQMSELELQVVLFMQCHVGSSSV